MAVISASRTASAVCLGRPRGGHRHRDPTRHPPSNHRPSPPARPGRDLRPPRRRRHRRTAPLVASPRLRRSPHRDPARPRPHRGREREVIAWVSRPADPAPVRILRSHPGAAIGWADELAAQSSADHRQRDSVWAGVRRAFDALADPRVLDACSPPPGQGFDAASFLDANGTLYLVGSTGAQLSVAPLIAALIEDVVESGRRRAASSQQGRLDPPLVLLLDEAANIAPIPSLPSLLADGGGSGITTVAVLQSLAQARGRWGESNAEAMWDAATIKVVLGGLAHAEDLQRISRLAGDVDELTETRTRGPGGTSVAQSVRRLPALPIEKIRGLPVGRAIILARRARPVEARLAPYWTS